MHRGWEDTSFMNQTSPLYLNQSTLPVQARLPLHQQHVSAHGTSAPHSYNINFHLNTVHPHDSRRLDLIYPGGSVVDSNYGMQQGYNTLYSTQAPHLSGPPRTNVHHYTSQSVRKQSILRQIQRDQRKAQREQAHSGSTTRQSISNFRKKIFFKQNANERANASMVNGPTPPPI